MSQQYFLVERGGMTYALPSELVTGVERFSSSLVRLELALGSALEVERVSMPVDAPPGGALRLSPGAARALPGALGVLPLPQGLVLAVAPIFFHPPPLSPRASRFEALADVRGGATGANGDAMLMHLSGTNARLLLPAAQVLEVIPRPEVLRFETSRDGVAALIDWQGSLIPVFGFSRAAPDRVAILRGTASPDACALMIDERVERIRWPLRKVHGALPGYVPPFAVRGTFGYDGDPLLIPDVDALAA